MASTKAPPPGRGEAASDAMRRVLELSRLRVLTALDTQPVVAKIAG